MTKEDLQKSIAETAYDVGFGSMLHFATFDIVQKAPGLISFISMAIGIIALIDDALNTHTVSASLIILGIMGLYISFRGDKKNAYIEKANKLLALTDELKILYFSVKVSNSTNFDSEKEKLNEISSQLREISDPDQILFSNWYAHYKFFWEHQIEWIHQARTFSFWRDKIPFSAYVAFGVIIIISIVCIIKKVVPCL